MRIECLTNCRTGWERLMSKWEGVVLLLESRCKHWRIRSWVQKRGDSRKGGRKVVGGGDDRYRSLDLGEE